MSAWNAFLFLSIISTSLAIPLEIRGTDCTPESMTVDERSWDCPHKYMINSSGSCSANIPKTPSPGCSAYCEMSLTMGYGEEIPIPQGYCGDQTPSCPWQASKTVSTTQTWEVNTNLGLSTREEVVPEDAALTASFSVGASYSYSKSLSYTTGTGASKALGPGQCGYWTFVPFVMTSCGTLSTVGETSPPPPPSLSGGASIQSPPLCGGKQGGKVVDTANWCNTAPYHDSDGHSDGVVIFVYVDCNTHKLLQNSEIPQTAPSNPGLQTQQSQVFYPGVFTGAGAPKPKI